MSDVMSDGGAQSIFALREITRVREIDYELEQLLALNTPMALLRDLHRPVNTFGVNPMDFEKEERIVDGGRRFVSEIKQTIYMSYRIPIVEIGCGHAMFVEAVTERRKILRSRWADAPKFGKQYLPGSVSGW